MEAAQTHELSTARDCPVCGRQKPGDARFCANCGHRFFGAIPAEEEVEVADAAVADPLIGRLIAERYRIVQVIGRGGMGVVYRVEHTRIGKMMAMKLLHGDLAREKESLRRFRREAEAASKLDHPNTVQVFDFGRSEGLTYLVMELLAGRDLNAIIEQEGALPFARVAMVTTQICGSVAQAHAHGIVHRDLKPENVRVLDGRSAKEGAHADFVKVMDFGLAKLRDSTENAGNTVTRAGLIVGTPYYMAPEVIRGEPADARSDVYAVGALMYKCLTGVPPYWAPTPMAVLTKHLSEPLTLPSERSPTRSIPDRADEIVARAMAKSPRDRYASMDALRNDLLDYLNEIGEGRASRSGPSGRIAVQGSDAFEVTDAGRKVAVATRGDVDRYERALRAQTWIFNGLIVLAVLAVIAGGVYAWRRFRTEVASWAAEGAMEREPNDTPAEANDLRAEQTRSAHLGRRISPEESDRDVWRIRNETREPLPARITVTAIPNMDLLVEVFLENHADPLLMVNGGGEGEGETIPNFVLHEPSYVVRVREVWIRGRRATENVSDAYEIRWQPNEIGEGEEREVNDSLVLAERIEPGQERRGYIGWEDDVDFFCVAEDLPSATVILEPIARLDLAIRIDERHLGRSQVIDQGRVGAGERAELSGLVAGQSCFGVTAVTSRGAPSSDPAERWALRLVR